MMLRSWIRSLSTRPVRTVRRSRLALVSLEDRTVPATFTVTTNNDFGANTLRQAIFAANSTPEADTITFDPTFFATPKTITLGAGELVIYTPVTITGPAAKVTVNANKTSRVFNTSFAADGASITIANLTITGGSSSTDGGGIFVGEEALTLSNCVVTGNTSAHRWRRHHRRLGIRGTPASLTLQNTSITGNTAGDDGGGIYFYDSGSLLMENSTISGNTARARRRRRRHLLLRTP